MNNEEVGIALTKTKSRYYYVVNTLNKKIIEKLNSEFRKIDETKRPILITTPHTELNVVTKIDKYSYKKEIIEDFANYEYEEKKVTKNLNI